MAIPIRRVPAGERLTAAWAELAPLLDALVSQYVHGEPRAHLIGLMVTVSTAAGELTALDPTETPEHRHDWSHWQELPSFSGGPGKHGRYCRDEVCDAQEVIGAHFPEYDLP